MLDAGSLRARIRRGAPWELAFEHDGGTYTTSGHKSVGYLQLAAGAPVAAEPAGIAGITTTGLAPAPAYVHEQLSLGVGELVYGLGERFGPLVKNGQTVDIWNADGGTSSEQAYKNVPFYLTTAATACSSTTPGRCRSRSARRRSSRCSSASQGSRLEYFVIDGPTPGGGARPLHRASPAGPPRVPDWSYGLWLSTSFTTDYDEATVNAFIDGMAERDIPLERVPLRLLLDARVPLVRLRVGPGGVPRPRGHAGPAARARAAGLRRGSTRTSRSARRCSARASSAATWCAGRTAASGSGTCGRPAWRWSTSPTPTPRAGSRRQLRRLLDTGRRLLQDRLRRADPDRRRLARRLRPRADAQLLHRSSTTAPSSTCSRASAARARRCCSPARRPPAASRCPVHWGGDCASTFTSMAESLRGGLSLALSGFGYWSHDIGGFEGDPDPAVFKRWLAFGLLSSTPGCTARRATGCRGRSTRTRRPVRARSRSRARSPS